MNSHNQAKQLQQQESRPDVNDPKTVERLTRAAIRILNQQAEANRRRKRWRTAG